MKKKLAIWMGYSEIFNFKNYKNKKMGGSELSALRFIDSFKDEYDIYVFGNSNNKNDIVTINGVHWSILSEYNSTQNKLNVKWDVLIIFRYINFFIYCPHDAKKTILWLEDMVINYYYDGGILPNLGQNLVYNCNYKIDKYVCLSQWHVDNMKKIYPFIENEKYEIIQNPINIPDNLKEDKKIKNKFIYVSDLSRGFEILLDCIIFLQNIFDDIKLVFFRKNELTDNMIEKLKKIKNVTAYGYEPPLKVHQEMITSEYFFYPSIFFETFCCSAVEAQLYECICIYNNIGCLNETIGDRGLSIDYNPKELNYVEKTCSKIIELINNDEIKKKFKEQGKNYALSTKMEKLKEKWNKIF